MKKADFLKTVQAVQPEMAGVAEAVISQIGGWRTFKDNAESITRNGMVAGFPGFTWYSDTIDFAYRNRDGIIAMMDRYIDEMGEDDLFVMDNAFREMHPTAADFRDGDEERLNNNVYLRWYVHLVSNFGVYNREGLPNEDREDLYRYLRGEECLDGGMPNLMAWFAAEEVAALYQYSL